MPCRLQLKPLGEIKWTLVRRHACQVDVGREPLNLARVAHYLQRGRRIKSRGDPTKSSVVHEVLALQGIAVTKSDLTFNVEYLCIHHGGAAGGLALSVLAVTHKEPKKSCYQARLVHPSASTALCRSG